MFKKIIFDVKKRVKISKMKSDKDKVGHEVDALQVVPLDDGVVTFVMKDFA
jgi:hypothetical protein